jgi:hypothetical protein
MPAMRRLLALAVAGSLASCAGGAGKLEVKQFTLRDTEVQTGDDPMVRGEKRRLLHGAVSVAEQRQRLGQYYTVQWQDESAGGPMEVVFEYQQGASGSKVKRAVQRFAAGETSGRAEFRVIGDDYTKGGRVLAWRISLVRGGHELANRRSYLWR